VHVSEDLNFKADLSVFLHISCVNKDYQNVNPSDGLQFRLLSRDARSASEVLLS